MITKKNFLNRNKLINTKGGEIKTMNKKILLIALITLVLVSFASAGNFIIRDSTGTNLLTLDNDTGALNITSGTISENGNLLSDIYCLLTGCSLSGGLNVTTLNVTTSVDFPSDSISEGDISFSTVCASGSHLYISGNDLACEPDTGADGNNYTEAISVSGTTTKTINVDRVGMINLTAEFTDIDTTIGNCSEAQSCTGIVYDGNLSIYHKFGNCDAGEFVQNTTATGVECATPTGTEDGNNYTEAISFSTAGATETLNLKRTGMANLTASFTDTDTTYSNSTGLSLSGTTFSVLDNYLLNTGDTVNTGDLVLNAVNLDLSNSANVTGGGSTTMGIDATGNFVITLG